MFQLPESDNTQKISDEWDTICITAISGCKTIFFRPIFRFRPLLACREAPASSALQRRLCLPCRLAHEAAGDSAFQPLSGLQVPLKSAAASPSQDATRPHRRLRLRCRCRVLFVAGRATVAFPAVAASAAADAAATRDGDAALAGFAVPVAAADVPVSAVGAVNAAEPGVAAECPKAGREVMLPPAPGPPAFPLLLLPPPPPQHIEKPTLLLLASPCPPGLLCVSLLPLPPLPVATPALPPWSSVLTPPQVLLKLHAL